MNHSPISKIQLLPNLFSPEWRVPKLLKIAACWLWVSATLQSRCGASCLWSWGPWRVPNCWVTSTRRLRTYWFGWWTTSLPKLQKCYLATTDPSTPCHSAQTEIFSSRAVRIRPVSQSMPRHQFLQLINRLIDFSPLVEFANLDLPSRLQGSRLPCVECQVFSTRLLLCLCRSRQNCPTLVHRQPAASASVCWALFWCWCKSDFNYWF